MGPTLQPSLSQLQMAVTRARCVVSWKTPAANSGCVSTAPVCCDIGMERLKTPWQGTGFQMQLSRQCRRTLAGSYCSGGQEAEHFNFRTANLIGCQLASI